MRARTFVLLAALPFLFAACAMAKSPLARTYYAKDYQWHKETGWIKVHWNIIQKGDKTVVAEGFVEPFNPRYGVFGVELNLVGLDAEGKVVNSASGRPADYNIYSPFDYSPFSIKMETNGNEKEFTITGSYYHFGNGQRPDLDPQFLDKIPLKTDEPFN